MEAAKPRIAILMAVYEPRLDWLREQLLSLNAQTYPNLTLYIRDDASPTVSYEDIEGCVQACITRFPCVMARNGKNVGSNRTFEQLTQEAEGDFFAYCDQDDVWLPEKLTVLEGAITESGALLVCSDMYVMDGTGRIVAGSITRLRRQRFASGTGLAGGLLFRNFVTGCTMLISAKEAKRAVPFCPYMVHDQYLALCCAQRGAILSLPRALVRYRIHGENQTRSLAGITDKGSYEEIRLQGTWKRLMWLEGHGEWTEEVREDIGRGLVWMQARLRHWRGQGGLGTLWRYCRFGLLTALFETVAPYLPERWFQAVVSLRRRTAW